MVMVVSPLLAAEPVPWPRPKYVSPPAVTAAPPAPTLTEMLAPAVIPAWVMAA